MRRGSQVRNGLGFSVRGRRDDRRAGGEAAYARIRWQSDPQIQQIISGWPQSLCVPRAETLGFVADSGVDEVIQAFIEDNLKMQMQLV